MWCRSEMPLYPCKSYGLSPYKDTISRWCMGYRMHATTHTHTHTHTHTLQTIETTRQLHHAACETTRQLHHAACSTTIVERVFAAAAGAVCGAVLSGCTISQAQMCGAVLSRSTGHSLEEWVGVDAAGSVKRLVTRPDHQGGRRRV